MPAVTRSPNLASGDSADASGNDSFNAATGYLAEEPLATTASDLASGDSADASG